MKPIKVVVVCATALATSTMAATKLEQEFKRRGIPVKMEKGRISDMRALVSMTHPDIVVGTTVCKPIGDIPVFDGVPLLSGRGVDKLFEELFKAVDEIIAKQEGATGSSGAH